MGDVHPDDPVRGRVIDDQGRCIHHGALQDVVCHRFPDEGWVFWACRQCHDDEVGAPARLWRADEAKELAVQCGVCRSILGIDFYLERQDAGEHSCPHCHTAWNPGCVTHRDRYFAF